MNKSKIFIVAGSTLLALVGFFTTKANSKFFSISGKLKVGTALQQTVTNLPTSIDEASFFTTVKAGAAATVKLITIGTSKTTLSTLFTAAGNNKLYFK